MEKKSRLRITLYVLIGILALIMLVLGFASRYMLNL